ncbi:MAG: radical SAM protein [Nitrososphaeria archaeon]
MSTIYHIVQFGDGSAYAMFDACDWKCTYCVRNVSPWCTSLPEGTVKTLNKIKIKHLNINELLEILKENAVKLVFLGGGEPTYDPELKTIMNRLKINGIGTWLITNGELLDDEIFLLSDGITFSIKAIDEITHIRLTGKSNRDTLKNFEKYGKSEKIVAETVFYPGLVDCEEVQKIAKFVHDINPDTRFRIDRAVQLKSMNGFMECVNKIKLIHERTYYFELNLDDQDYPKLLYPKF